LRVRHRRRDFPAKKRARQRRHEVRHEVVVHQALRVLLQPTQVVRGERVAVCAAHGGPFAPARARLVVEIHLWRQNRQREARGHIPERPP
jgi:hypothetical protein